MAEYEYREFKSMFEGWVPVHSLNRGTRTEEDWFRANRAGVLAGNFQLARRPKPEAWECVEPPEDFSLDQKEQ